MGILGVQRTQGCGLVVNEVGANLGDQDSNPKEIKTSLLVVCFRPALL